MNLIIYNNKINSNTMFRTITLCFGQKLDIRHKIIKYMHAAVHILFYNFLTTLYSLDYHMFFITIHVNIHAELRLFLKISLYFKHIV